MTMKAMGIAGHKAAIEQNLSLARYLVDQVRAAPDLELMAPPGLSIVCFRYVGNEAQGRSRAEGTERSTAPAADEATLGQLNRWLLERLQLGGEAFLTSTELRGRFTLRACFVNYRSTQADVDRMLDAVRALGTTYQRK